jgi:hypothetical protein
VAESPQPSVATRTLEASSCPSSKIVSLLSVIRRRDKPRSYSFSQRFLDYDCEVGQRPADDVTECISTGRALYDRVESTRFLERCLGPPAAPPGCRSLQAARWMRGDCPLKQESF